MSMCPVVRIAEVEVSRGKTGPYFHTYRENHTCHHVYVFVIENYQTYLFGKHHITSIVRD